MKFNFSATLQVVPTLAYDPVSHCECFGYFTNELPWLMFHIICKLYLLRILKHFVSFVCKLRS